MTIHNRTFYFLDFTAVVAVMLIYITVVFANESDMSEANTVRNNDAEKGKALASKLGLLDRLVHDSPAAKRISASTNFDAKQSLQDAGEALEKARQEYEAGNMVSSEKYIGQGLAAMTYASRSVVDLLRAKKEQEENYWRLRERVSSFTAAFHRVLAEKQQQPVAELLNMRRVDALLSEADILAKNGDYMAANKEMMEAADAVEIALSQARDKETLYHELKFDSFEDEYAYELQRNHTYKLLIDFIKNRKAPSTHGLDQLQKAVQDNELVRKEADALVRNGKIEQGIQILEKGTDRLARILRATGLVF